MADDYSASTRTEGTVGVGGTASGNIETGGDRDWFAVELVAGRTYTIDLRGRPTEDGTLSDPYLRGIHDADGNLIPGTTNDDWGGTYNSRVTFTASESGTYYIAAGAWGNNRGTYEVEVMDNSPPAPAPPATPIPPTTGQTASERAGADLAADPSTTGRVAVGETATGNIESAGDRDWFAVELVAGRTYTIDLRGRPTADGTLSDPYLRGIHDAEGNLLSGTTNDDWGGTYNSRVTFTASESGTHYIAAGAFSSRQGTYELEVTDNSPSAPAPEPPAIPLQQTTPRIGSEPAGADLAAGPSTTGRVAVGETATGNIESAGDRDWFAVELVAGRTYTIDLRGTPTGDGTLSDPYLRGIHDAQGNLLSGTTNDDWGGTYNSRVTFTATESGIHYIAAGAFSSRQGTYEVEVTDNSPEPAEEAPSVRVSDAEATEGDDAEIVFRVTLSAAASGPVTVRYATADVTAVAGEDYEAASGTLTFAPGETERTVRVRVLDDAVEDSGETFRLVLSAPAGATLADPEALGTILNTEPVSEPPNGDLPAGPSTPGRVVVGDDPVTGEIDYDRYYVTDRDWFAVELEGGRHYRIDLEGSETLHGRIWGIYRVEDGSAVPKLREEETGTGEINPEAGNATVWIEAPANGTYYIEVSGREGRRSLEDDDVSRTSGPANYGDYRLSVVEDLPEVRVEDVETVEDADAEMFFHVRLDRAYVEPVTVAYTTADGTATAGADYTATSGTLTFAPGETHKVVRVRVLDDTVADTGETFRLVLSAPAGASLADAEATATILHDPSVSEPDGGDLPAAQATSGQVSVGGSATGTISPSGTFGRGSDKDWFAVELEAGKLYRIDLKGASTGDGSLEGTKIQRILVSDHVAIATLPVQDSGEGGNARVYFTPGETRTYYIETGARTGDTGTYTLAVEEVVDAFTASPSTTGRVAVGGTAMGESEFEGDRDWFRAELEAGRTYQMDLEGSPTGEGTMGDPHLFGIHRPDGSRIDQTSDSQSGDGANARVFFTPEAGGTYWIAAGGHVDSNGTYRLSVSDVTATEIPASTATTATVAVGGTVTRRDRRAGRPGLVPGHARERHDLPDRAEPGQRPVVAAPSGHPRRGRHPHPRHARPGRVRRGARPDFQFPGPAGGVVRRLLERGHLHPGCGRNLFHRRRLRLTRGRLRAVGRGGDVAAGPGSSRARAPSGSGGAGPDPDRGEAHRGGGGGDRRALRRAGRAAAPAVSRGPAGTPSAARPRDALLRTSRQALSGSAVPVGRDCTGDAGHHHRRPAKGGMPRIGAAALINGSRRRPRWWRHSPRPGPGSPRCRRGAAPFPDRRRHRRSTHGLARAPSSSPRHGLRHAGGGGCADASGIVRCLSGRCVPVVRGLSRHCGSRTRTVRGLRRRSGADPPTPARQRRLARPGSTRRRRSTRRRQSPSGAPLGPRRTDFRGRYPRPLRSFLTQQRDRVSHRTVQRHDSGGRHAVARDDHVLASLRPGDQMRQPRLGLSDVDGSGHGTWLRRWLSNLATLSDHRHLGQGLVTACGALVRALYAIRFANTPRVP